ncbi:protein of unknown function [Marivirga sericea]|uniref:DUF4365 domain-containing protein n=1 Tax=Marivirga sericea TaxID=1028 RepID=A0A1X7L6S1_9BACT|nr:DUF4365 domain-containing protein [Marivirga sericea]SMG49164.1 protein of unknown function [Marivirga sericea]
MPNYPQRNENHVLENRSRNFLRRYLPQEWTSQDVEYDYGQDMLIEISENGEMRGLGLIIQLKASHTANVNPEFETLILRQQTYNYLWDRLEVVLLVKYVQEENEAYYKLLSEVQPPENPDQENFTIRIPKTNTISTLDWNVIVNYVREITDLKLNAVRNRRR